MCDLFVVWNTVVYLSYIR